MLAHSESSSKPTKQLKNKLIPQPNSNKFYSILITNTIFAYVKVQLFLRLGFFKPIHYIFFSFKWMSIIILITEVNSRERKMKVDDTILRV